MPSLERRFGQLTKTSRIDADCDHQHVSDSINDTKGKPYIVMRLLDQRKRGAFDVLYWGDDILLYEGPAYIVIQT